MGAIIAKHRARLAPEERELIDGYLNERGTNISELTFSGRMIRLEDDVDLDADEMLAARDSDKSGVPSHLILHEEGEDFDPAPDFCARLRASTGAGCAQGTAGRALLASIHDGAQPLRGDIDVE